MKAEPGDYPRSERREGVGALGAQPLQVIALPLALADIVADGDTEDVAQRLFTRDFAGALADDDDQLTFEVQVAGIGGVDDVGLFAKMPTYLATCCWRRR